MKEILISIQPKYVGKIAKGEKTIEVRKTNPKLDTPFKCYIYCTKGNGMNGDILIPSGIQCGRVIGEFVCDRTHEWTYNKNVGEYNIGGDSIHRTCLSCGEFEEYGKGKTLYGWHICDLKIYDEPKELGEFGKPCECATFNNYDGRWYCDDWEYNDCRYVDRPSCGGETDDYEDYAYCLKDGKIPFMRPPQSWCYVEEVGEL